MAPPGVTPARVVASPVASCFRVICSESADQLERLKHFGGPVMSKRCGPGPPALPPAPAYPPSRIPPCCLLSGYSLEELQNCHMVPFCVPPWKRLLGRPGGQLTLPSCVLPPPSHHSRLRVSPAEMAIVSYYSLWGQHGSYKLVSARLCCHINVHNQRQRRLRLGLNAVSIDWPLGVVNSKYFIILYML